LTSGGGESFGERAPGLHEHQHMFKLASRFLYLLKMLVAGFEGSRFETGATSGMKSIWTGRLGHLGEYVDISNFCEI